MSIEYTIWSAMIDFALSLKYLNDREWIVCDHKYGEEKYGIPDSLVLQRGGEYKYIDSLVELEDFIKEINQENY